MVDWPWVDLPQATPIRILSWNFYVKLELGKKKLVSLFLESKVMTCDSQELFLIVRRKPSHSERGSLHTVRAGKMEPACTWSQSPEAPAVQRHQCPFCTYLRF